MLMLSRRLQVLIDDGRYARLEQEATRQRVPVSVLVREAIDAAFPVAGDARHAAGQHVLDATPMPVPDVEELTVELDRLRGRRG